MGKRREKKLIRTESRFVICIVESYRVPIVRKFKMENGIPFTHLKYYFVVS